MRIVEEIGDTAVETEPSVRYIAQIMLESSDVFLHHKDIVFLHIENCHDIDIVMCDDRHAKG